MPPAAVDNPVPVHSPRAQVCGKGGVWPTTGAAGDALVLCHDNTNSCGSNPDLKTWSTARRQPGGRASCWDRLPGKYLCLEWYGIGREVFHLPTSETPREDDHRVS